MSAWLKGPVEHRHDWFDGLSTFRLPAGPRHFEPGQFVNVALQVGQQRVRRAYSLASAPGEAPEFFISRVDGGMFTQELFSLAEGAEVEVETSPSGFFTLKWLPDFAKDLWLVSSGTGLGPFISMLRTPGALRHFEHVVVVHCVRQRAQLAYRQELEALAARDSRVRYLPVVTREEGQGDESGRLLFGRLPSQVSSGSLEHRAGIPLSAERGHIMLCGNPEMIRDTSVALTERGLRRHLKRAPGHITTEKYW